MALKAYAWGVLFLFISCFLMGTVFSYNLLGLTGIDSGYDLKRIIAVGFYVVCGLGLTLTRSLLLIKVSFMNKVILSMLACFAWYCAVVSQHPYWGGVELANLVLLLIGFYLFSSYLQAIASLKVLYSFYAFSLLISALTACHYFLLLTFHYFDAQSLSIHSLLPGYANARFFNQIQVMLLPLLLLSFVLPALRPFKRVSMVFLAIHWLMLLQTEARGAILALVMALAVLLAFLAKELRKCLLRVVLRSIFFGVGLWLLLIVILPYWITDTTSVQIRTGSSGRIDLWLYVLQVIPERLWTGFGPMSFSWADNKPLPNAHPHNVVMQLLYEYGVVVCIIITAWVVQAAYRCLTSLQRIENKGVIPVFYAVLSALIYSLVSGVMVMPLAQLLLVGLLSVWTALLSKGDVTKEVLSGASNTCGSGCRVGLLGLTLIAAYSVLSSYHNLQLTPHFMPRIWVNGLIG